jgi:non-ribosomal peptide synthetase component F
MASTSTVVITPAPRGRNPFSQEGVERGPDGVLRYTNRPPSLIALLENAAKRNPEAVAVAEIGGRRLTYGELHARCAAVAGGLREAGVGSGYWRFLGSS